MSVIKLRKPTGPFEVIDRATIDAIRDPVALAVWVFLRAKPEGWIVRESHVREQFGIGRDKYRASIRYLIGLGAVEDRRIQDEYGQITGRELVVQYSAAIPDGFSVDRAPENPAYGFSDDAGLDRAPENPAHGFNRAPEKPVRRIKPSDGKTTYIENTHLPRENRFSREQTDATKISAIVKDSLEVIQHLNEKAGKNFRGMTKDGKPDASVKQISDLLKDYDKSDLIAVIDSKCSEWVGTEYATYLRPSTLFRRSKFVDYLGSVGTAKPKNNAASAVLRGGV